MIKKLVIILLFLLLPILCFADAGLIGEAGGDESGGTCTVANDSQQFIINGAPGTSVAGVVWAADKFVLASQTTITMYKSRQCKAAESVSGTVELEIFNHDAGNDQPDETSVVANSAVSMVTNDLVWCDSGENLDEFILSSTFVLSAGTYWIVNKTIGSSGRNIKYAATSTGNRAASSTDSGSSWSTFDNTAYDMEVWGCTD